MNPIILFWIVFALMAIIIIYFDKKYSLLRDHSTASIKAFSFSRVQLTWWTLIVFSSFISIIFCNPYHNIPVLMNSTLYLLGISSATMATATIIDVSDKSDRNLTQSTLNQNSESQSFFLDILSDKSGVSITRFQAVILNIVFGIWFITKVLGNLNNNAIGINNIMPDISSNDMILLGLSSSTYAGLKSMENKQTNSNSSPNNSIEQPPVG